MLRAMLDSAPGQPTEGPGQPADPTPPPTANAAMPGYLPFVAYPGAYPPPSPPAPTWTRAYELPSARRVVSSGLQLAVDASAPIRRASIYIGLLALGAFGPAVVLLLLGIARLLSDPATAQLIAKNPQLVLLQQPEIVGPLALIYVLVLSGLLLLIAISVDVQGIAISILGGRASDRPMRLWEAITRARQVFWRLSGAGFLVGLASGIVSLVVTVPFMRSFDSNTGVSFIGTAVGTLVVTPFAFAGTSIVLGDVGAVEALRRSMALFRARPRIAFVVTLFTLVTSAIQTFALGAGLDIAVRVGTFTHLSLDQGGIAPLLVTILVLAFVMAYGSLTFTIAAIVAAPQVAGFLGLTYFSGGLDKARTTDGRRPPRFRWVSIPMLLAMIGLLALAGFGLPSVVGFQPRAASPLLAFLSAGAQAHGELVSPLGSSPTVDDPTGDQSGRVLAAIDIVAADYAFLPTVPPWLLADSFDCNAANVACGSISAQAAAYDEGAYIFVQRMAAAPTVAADSERWEWGPVLALDGYDLAPSSSSEPFAGASHAIVTRVVGTSHSLAYLGFDHGSFHEYRSYARSTWIGDELITIVPVTDEILSEPLRWDAFASLIVGGTSVSSDTVRSSTSPGTMRDVDPRRGYWLLPIGGLPS